MSAAPATSAPFKFIYYDDYCVGNAYEMLEKDGNKPHYLGRLVKKELTSRSYDPDMLLTFEKDGSIYKYIVDFTAKYRVVP